MHDRAAKVDDAVGYHVVEGEQGNLEIQYLARAKDAHGEFRYVVLKARMLNFRDRAVLGQKDDVAVL